MNRNTIIVLACYIIAIWCFFLPWARIGFWDTSTISITGYDIIKGIFQTQGAVLDKNPVSELLTLLAAITVIAGLIAGVFKNKLVLIARVILGLAGAGLLFALSYTIPGYITSLSEFRVPTSFLPAYWLAIATLVIASIIGIVTVIVYFMGKRQGKAA